MLHIDIKAFLQDHHPNRRRQSHHTTIHTPWGCFVIPRSVMGVRPATGKSGYLEPSQLITEEVLAILVTFEGAGEVQVHLRLHVL